MICSNFLKNEWTSQCSLSTALLYVNLLLQEPLPEDAFDSKIGQMYSNDYSAYYHRAREWTQEYAM